MIYARSSSCISDALLRSPIGLRAGLSLFTNLALSLVCGCSSWVQSDRVQCSTNEDCTRRGGDFANSICTNQLCDSPDSSASSDSSGPWSCLDDVVWPAATSANVNVVVNLVDLITSEPVPGLTGRVCYKLDTTCDSPLRTDLVSDAAGRMSFTISSGFDGYLESTSSGIMPFLYFFYPPVTTDRDVPNVPILQSSGLSTFASLAGAELMPDRGHLLARAYNCLGQTAEGVRLSSPEGDASTVAFYMIKGIPSTKQSETDSSGDGGLLNLRPGTATLTGTLDNGDTIDPLSAMTRVGRITYTSLVPAPR